MDPRALELMRLVQAGSQDVATLDAARELFPDVRAALVAAGDAATLADLRGLLEEWASAASPALRADALVLASGLVEGSERARILRAVGQLRLEQAGDVDGAITVYEEALDEDADVALTRELADLYALRAGDGDAGRAADLYALLGELAEGSERAALLEKALDLAPGHVAALDLLEADVPENDRPMRFRERWEAFIGVTSDEPAAAARRIALARADGALRRYRDGLLWLAPLVDRGDPTALRLKEAFLASLEDTSPAVASVPPSVGDRPLPARVLSPRSGQTMVGFKVPGGLTADSTMEAVEAARRALVAQADAATPPAQSTQREIAAAAPAVAAATPALSAGFEATMLGLPHAAAPAAAAATPASTPAASAGFEATMLGLPQAVAPAAGVDALGATRPSIPVPAGGIAAPANANANANANVSAPRRAGTALGSGARSLGIGSVPSTASWPPVAPRGSKSAPPRDPFASAPPGAPRASGPVVFRTHTEPGAPAPDPFGYDDVNAMRRGVSMPDKRWLIGGAAVAVVILVAVIPWGGDAAPTVAPDTRSSSVPPAAPPTLTPVAPPASAEAAPTPATAEPAEPPAPSSAASSSAGKAVPSASGAAKRAPSSGEVTLHTKVARVRGGKITLKQLSGALAPQLDAFERCYADALARETRLSGRLVLEWTVRSGGRASGVKKLPSTIHDTRLYQCEAGVIGKTRFADPGRKAAQVRMGFDHARGK